MLDHENKNMERVVIGAVINEAEISDQEVTSIMSSTTLVKTSPVMGMFLLIMLFIFHLLVFIFRKNVLMI